MRTPDGLGSRAGSSVAARILDGFIVLLRRASRSPATSSTGTSRRCQDQVSNGTYPSFSPTGEVLRWELWLVAVLLVLQVGYETFSLRRWERLPGNAPQDQRAHWERGGRLPWSAIGRRVGFIYGLSALGLVPVVGLLAGIVALLELPVAAVGQPPSGTPRQVRRNRRRRGAPAPASRPLSGEPRSAVSGSAGGRARRQEEQRQVGVRPVEEPHRLQRHGVLGVRGLAG